MGEEKVLLTIDEASTRLSLGRTATYSLVQRGQLGSVKIGRSRRIPVSELARFVGERLEEQAGA